MQATGILCIKGRLFVVSFTTSELSQKLRFTQSFCFFEISETDCTTLKIHPSISRNTANVYQITHAMTGSMRFDSFIHLFLAAKQTSCMFLSLYEVVQQLFFQTLLASSSAGCLHRRLPQGAQLQHTLNYKVLAGLGTPCHTRQLIYRYCNY